MTDETLSGAFIELTYFVGEPQLRDSLRALVPRADVSSIPTIILVPNAIGLVLKPEEIEAKNGRITVRSEGNDFCGVGSGPSESEMRGAGEIVYKRFVEYAEKVDCLYGAILIEKSLESPHELAKGADSDAFGDCFLSRRRLPGSVIERVLKRVGTLAYVEETRSGIYISRFPPFNPRQQRLSSPEWHQLSADIGRIIGEGLDPKTLRERTEIGRLVARIKIGSVTLWKRIRKRIQIQ